MNVKQFLKPDWRKIVLTIVLMIIPSLFITSYSIYVASCVGCGYFFNFESFGILFVISLIITYLLSCFIVWVYDKFRKKKVK